MFENRDQASDALLALIEDGFPRDQIGVVMKDDQAGSTAAGEMLESPEAKGALTGAVTGLGLGALAGLGVLSGVIPVIGPAIAAGTLGVLVSNAAAGAGIAGLVGALIGAGVPDEEARYYESEFEAGRLIMTVEAGTRGREAATILHDHGAYDVHSRRDGGRLGAATAVRPGNTLD
ncbi:MAG: hypothetical protein K2X91_04795 [Thermoleophilia bacterium]|nr:hypothetical protein [Thermoleophilia bacterium]